jgi:AraC-like DNA-binding protein
MTKEDRENIVAALKAGMTLIEAENKFGFNKSNLSRQFKRMTGMSLREWKKQNA